MHVSDLVHIARALNSNNSQLLNSPPSGSPRLPYLHCSKSLLCLQQTVLISRLQGVAGLSGDSTRRTEVFVSPSYTQSRPCQNSSTPSTGQFLSTHACSEPLHLWLTACLGARWQECERWVSGTQQVTSWVHLGSAPLRRSCFML